MKTDSKQFERVQLSTGKPCHVMAINGESDDPAQWVALCEFANGSTADVPMPDLAWLHVPLYERLVSMVKRLKHDIRHQVGCQGPYGAYCTCSADDLWRDSGNLLRDLGEL